MFSNYLLYQFLTILPVLSVAFGCTPTPPPGRTPGTFVTYSKVDDTPRIALAETMPAKTFSKRSVPVGLSGDLESFFLSLDDNDDGKVDASEWLRAPFETRLRDFANLVEDVDLDGDDSVSWKEFQVVKLTVHKIKEVLAPTTPS